MKNKNLLKIDSEFLAYLRGVSIFIIVFGHVGGFWVFGSYSGLLHLSVTTFFFLSGAVSYYSFLRAGSVRQYYIKRISGLIIPFYLLGILSLFVYLATYRHLPSLSMENIIMWLTVKPVKTITPFPIGQVWFLHTLLIISIVSPLYYKLYEKNKSILILILIIFLSISCIQAFIDIDEYFYIGSHNFFKPIVHSIFFISGFVYFTYPQYKNNKQILLLMFVLSILLCFGMVLVMNQEFDFSKHTFAPDIYYVFGTYSLLSLLFLLQNFIIKVVNRIKPVYIFLRFMYKHTFSIFLLHSFAIYLSEVVFNIVEPQNKDFIYGVKKLLIVLLITFILSVPYSYISSYIIKKTVKLTT